MLDQQLMRLFSEPLAIAERELGVIQTYALRTLCGEDGRCAETLARLGAGPVLIVPAAPEGKAPQAAAANLDGIESSTQLLGSTAVISIWGVLDHTDPKSKGKRVGTGYDRVAAEVNRARSDDRVGAILLYIDSPGGAVRGIDEGASAIFAAAEAGRAAGDSSKPVIAFAPRLMASAALYLGSQAAVVYIGPGAWVGSIGVRQIVGDFSEQLSREGIKVNTIKSGEFKDLGSPYRAMTDRDREKLQAEVNTYFGHFKSAVSKGRRMSMGRVEELATGEGFIGEKAVAVGLADGIRGSVSELAAELSDKYPAPSRRGAGRGGARNSAEAPAQAGNGKGPNMDPNVKDGAGGTGAATQAGGGAPGGAPAQAGGGGVIANIDPAAIAAQAAAFATPIVQQQVQANQLRITQIQGLAKPYAHIDGVMDLERTATADMATTVDGFKAKLFDKVQSANAPVGSIDISMGATQWEKERAAIETVLVGRMGGPQFLDSMRKADAHGLAVIDAWQTAGKPLIAGCAVAKFENPQAFHKAYREAEANGFRRLRLMDIAERCAMNALGQAVRRFGSEDEILAAAFGHGSSDFPNLLAAAGQKLLMKYFAEFGGTWERWCAIGDSKDFKPTDMITLSELPNLKVVPEGSPLQEATFNERKQSISVLEYGRKTSVTRQTMINDDLSGFQEQWKLWGQTAKRTPEALAYGVLQANSGTGPTMADGTVMFHTNHRNILTGGSTGVLTRANLIKAVKKMMLQKGFGKDQAPLMIQPKNLLAPVELWDIAVEIVTSVIDPTRSNTNSNVPNVITRLGLNEPITSAYMDLVSSDDWYLLGDPSSAPTVQLNFLNGNRNPIITQVGNGSIRGVEYEIIFDVGAAARNFESAVFGDGT